MKDAGVSPAFFAAYEKTEGDNSKWGWLNHTDRKSDPVADAKSVAKWVVDQSKNTSDDPAWVDQGNPKDFVPSDVKKEGNKHFEGLKKKTIGRVVIAGTAAGTWEVYYPKGLKEEYNGVQDYSKPINNMMETIDEWGGNITGGSVLFVFPVHKPRRITQKFKGADHFGIDLAGENPGDQPNIHAVADGEVTRSEVSDSYGEVIYMKHKDIDGKNWESVYAHMKDGSRTVKKGEKVKQDQKIGVMGETGQANGVHLHFELHQPSWNADKTHAVNPEDYLDEPIEDGDDGDDGNKKPKNSNKDWITLLVTDAVNGWRL